MPHEPETSFQQRVKYWLTSKYGEANVREEVVLPVTRNRADLHVETPSAAPDMVFETEDDWGGVESSYGQLLGYADQLDARPFIVVPEGHVEWPEILHLYDSPVQVVPFTPE